ncbi:MAG: hypothetical protein WC755_03365 [Candidatus Woesearchaeota archaeon]|jgi:hypothetical protein
MIFNNKKLKNVIKMTSFLIFVVVLFISIPEVILAETSNDYSDISIEDAIQSVEDNNLYRLVEKNIYRLTPKFKVSSNYNLNVYDVIMSDVNVMLICSDKENIQYCLEREKLPELNFKNNNFHLKYILKMLPEYEKDEDYSVFYNFIRALYRIRNAENDDCVAEYETFSGIGNFDITFVPDIDGTIIRHKSYEVKVDFVVGLLSNGMTTLNYKEKTVDSDTRYYFLKTDYGMDIFLLDNQQEKDLKTVKIACKTREFMFNFYAEYDSYYGKQFIPFSLDFSNSAPPKISEFTLEQKPKDENKFILKWDEVKDEKGNKIDDLKEYRIYCADYNFSNDVSKVLYESVNAGQDNYEKIISSCNNTNIQTGKEYYFEILTVDLSGNSIKKGVLSKNITAIDKLAPGISKDYKQIKTINKADAQGLITLTPPTINEDGSKFFNFSNYLIFYTKNNYDSLLLSKIAGFNSINCQNKIFDSILSYNLQTTDINFYCYVVSKERVVSLTKEHHYGYFNGDSFDVVYYVIPVDSSGNFIKTPLDWARDNIK